MAALASLALLVSGPLCHAGILGPDSGNSTASNGHPAGLPFTDGTFNFAVYKNNGGPGNDVFGTGFANLDTSGVTSHNSKSTSLGPSATAPFDTHAKYLYVYQISNNGPGIDFFNTKIPVTSAKNITSYGVLVSGTTPLGFKYDGGLVNGQQLQSKGANNFGPATFGGNPSQLTGFQQNAPARLIGSNVGPSNPAIATNPGVFKQIGLDLQSNELIVSFGSKGLRSGNTSELFYFTSNAPPSLLFAELTGERGTGPSALGQVASPSASPLRSAAPAPPAVVLSLLGIAMFGAAYGLRRRRAGALPA
jgi:hypothetical protein